MATNYTQVSNFTHHNTTQGYGWAPGGFPSGSGATDFGAGGGRTALTQDAVYSSDMTFWVDLPNGTYMVSPAVGQIVGVGRMADLFLQDRWAGFVNTAANTTATVNYVAAVTTGRLALRVVAAGEEGTNPKAYLAGLSIVPLDFDFGTNASPLAPGTTRVSNFTVYDSANPQRGYGWTALPSGSNASDRGAGTGRNALTQDHVYSPDMTFRVDVPNGIYSVVITFGDHDAGFAHAAEVYLQGSATPEAAQLAPAKGSVMVKRYRVNVTGGILSVRLKGLAGTGRSELAYLQGLSVLPG